MTKTAQQIYEHYFSHVTTECLADRQFERAKTQEIEAWLKGTYADVEWMLFPVAMTEITLAWGKVEAQTWSKIPGLLTALEEAAVRLDSLTNWIENSYCGKSQDVGLGRSYARAARAAVTKAEETISYD